MSSTNQVPNQITSSISFLNAISTWQNPKLSLGLEISRYTIPKMDFVRFKPNSRLVREPSILGAQSKLLTNSFQISVVCSNYTWSENEDALCQGDTVRKKHRKSTEHFWSTICPYFPYSMDYGSSVPVFCFFVVVFCTEPYGHHREYVQTLCTLSVSQCLCIFCAKARIFFQWR